MLQRILYLLISLLPFVLSHSLVEIDNGIVGEPEVQCGSDSISILFRSKNPFIGKMFVKGFVADSNCIAMGDNKKTHRFTVKHDSCGVRRQREVNGVVIVSTVIISFHSIFITKVDKAYRLSCFYVEATKKVQQQLDIAALTTQSLESQTQLPVCRYEILSDGPGGVPIKYAKIGDTVYHKWTCVSELSDVYCMRVHSCTVYDGQGGPPVTVLDTNGCSVDGVILQNLDYLGDLSAGKPAQVFKFADKAGLYFNCQIQLTIKDKDSGCSLSQPDCGGQTYVQPSSQTTEVSNDYASSHESGYQTKAANEYPVPSTTQGYATTIGYRTKTTESALNYPEPSSIKISSYEDKSGEGPMPPGTAPSYEELLQNGTTGYKVPASTEVYEEEETSYKRLIRRRSIQAPGTRTNRTQPVTVVDFDLPERGLIVFGLEDDNGMESLDPNENSARLIVDDKSAKTCFTTNKLLTFFILCLVSMSGLLVGLGLVVYRQRRLISQPFLKH